MTLSLKAFFRLSEGVVAFQVLLAPAMTACGSWLRAENGMNPRNSDSESQKMLVVREYSFFSRV